MYETIGNSARNSAKTEKRKTNIFYKAHLIEEYWSIGGKIDCGADNWREVDTEENTCLKHHMPATQS